MLHVEPEDLKVLTAVAEDVDDALQRLNPLTEALLQVFIEMGHGSWCPKLGSTCKRQGRRRRMIRKTLVQPWPGATTAGMRWRQRVTYVPRTTHSLCPKSHRGVGGKVVVRANILGTVVGPSGQDPGSRITVAFAWREDGKSNNLNVIASNLLFTRVHFYEPSLFIFLLLSGGSWRFTEQCLGPMSLFQASIPWHRGEIRRVDAPSCTETDEICAICLAELASQPEEAGRLSSVLGFPLPVYSRRCALV